jgi:hypothetical protein
MVNIQVSNGLLDVVENTAFPITLSASDIRDPSKKKGGFSKSIELTGSKNNLDLLGHLYNVNIEDSTFDINALTECTVIQNGVVVCERYYLQMLSVNKQQYSNTEDEIITFTVVVKDSVSDFFTEISNRFLSDVDLSDLNHVFNATNVINSFTNTVANGYKYPLMYTPNTTIPIREFRPAVYVKTYFDRIFARAGKSYTWSALNEARFNKLLIPYNSDGGSINPDNYKVQWTKSTSASNSTHVINWNNISPTITSTTEIVDNNGNYNPTTGQYSSPFYVSTGESINISVNASINLTLTNTETGIAQPKIFVNPSIPTVQNTTARYTSFLQVFRNGVNVANIPLLDTGNVIFSIPSLGSINPFNGSVTNTAQITNINIGDVITWKVRTVGASIGFWGDNTADQKTVTSAVTHNFDVTVTPSENNSGLFSTLDMNQFIPKEIKQSDFVKSIFTMYNLWAIPDVDQPDNIILIQRDEYLDSGTSIDWSNKLDKQQAHTITFLPDITAKRTILTYKADSDAVNQAYTSTTNEIFGQVDFTFDSEHTKGDDKRELIFSPTPSVVTTYGAVVPLITGSAPKTNIRILIDSGTDTLTTPITIQQFAGSNFTSSVYPLCSHFENPENPSFDINFGVCDYYLYPIANVTANNLYNLYWRRTMAQLNEGSMLTGYFNLNESDIQRLKMNDKIFTLNSWWYINQIIDYSANNRTLTKVELLSADETIDLPPFKIKPTKPFFNGDVIPIRNIYVKKFYELNNTIKEGGTVYSGIGQTVSEGGLVVSDVKTETINGVKANFEPRYRFVLTQTGTNAPVITKEIQNDFDIQPTITRDSVGIYRFSNMTTEELYTLISTEDYFGFITEDDYGIILEETGTSILSELILGATSTNNLVLGDYYRFKIDGDDLLLLTYSGGVLSDDVIPTDIPFIVDLFFNEF